MGQRVVEGLVLQVALELASLGDVVERDDDTTDARVVDQVAARDLELAYDAMAVPNPPLVGRDGAELPLTRQDPADQQTCPGRVTGDHQRVDRPGPTVRRVPVQH
jgi:hypothetical protein